MPEPGKAKQRWRQYFNTLYNDPNAINVDHNEKHFCSYSNTKDDEEILNIHRSKKEESIKKSKCRKAPGVNVIMVEKLEVVTIGSGAHGASQNLQ